jgi:hypothetical protein
MLQRRETILQYKSLCASTTPTYRSIAQRIVDLYEEHNGVPIKSYHLPVHGNCPGSARIVHHLTKEKATRVRVRLVVPEHKGVVASVCDLNIGYNGAIVSIANPTLDKWKTATCVFPTQNSKECREWILCWNKVDQRWELEEKYVLTKISFPTASSLHPEWRINNNFDEGKCPCTLVRNE